jgi:uncharacterized membrane protein YcgQ (UPF0703/DUF1980 family)
MRIFKKFKSVTLCSAILSVTCFFIGVIVSYIYATPTGASVVVINILAFMVFWGISALSRGRKTAISASAVSLAALFLFFGCGNTKNFLQKNNAAGTLSVTLPSGLSGEEPVSSASAPERDRGEPVEIREKMFIAQVNDVYLNPEEYLGRTIKLEGLFKSEQYGEQPYCFVIRYGPGCCGNDGNSGFEIAWNNQDAADKPYPDIDDWVEATGVLQTYEEDGYPYLYLALSSLNVLDDRGAEFVTQ